MAQPQALHAIVLPLSLYLALDCTVYWCGTLARPRPRACTSRARALGQKSQSHIINQAAARGRS